MERRELREGILILTHCEMTTERYGMLEFLCKLRELLLSVWSGTDDRIGRIDSDEFMKTCALVASTCNDRKSALMPTYIRKLLSLICVPGEMLRGINKQAIRAKCVDCAESIRIATAGKEIMNQVLTNYGPEIKVEEEKAYGEYILLLKNRLDQWLILYRRMIEIEAVHRRNQMIKMLEKETKEYNLLLPTVDQVEDESFFF